MQLLDFIMIYTLNGCTYRLLVRLLEIINVQNSTLVLFEVLTTRVSYSLNCRKIKRILALMQYFESPPCLEAGILVAHVVSGPAESICLMLSAVFFFFSHGLYLGLGYLLELGTGFFGRCGLWLGRQCL